MESSSPEDLGLAVYVNFVPRRLRSGAVLDHALSFKVALSSPRLSFNLTCSTSRLKLPYGEFDAQKSSASTYLELKIQMAAQSRITT